MARATNTPTHPSRPPQLAALLFPFRESGVKMGSCHCPSVRWRLHYLLLSDSPEAIKQLGTLMILGCDLPLLDFLLPLAGGWS